jgi:TATA-box binding protein (TBP) (component of TFIID and TFIIIB)
MCMGNSSLKASKKDLRKYARLVNKQGYSVSLECITAVTKSAVATLSGKLNMHEASTVLKGRYDPEIFMAVMFRKDGVNFTCFHSGKVIMTGVKKLKYLLEMLMELEMFTL